MEWTSDQGVFTSFQERGQNITDNTSLTISPLTPSTKYDFKVAMVNSEGEGEDVRTVITTSKEVGGMIYETAVSTTAINSLVFCSADKLAYFQIRIQGIGDCEDWHVCLPVVQLLSYASQCML